METPCLISQPIVKFRKLLQPSPIMHRQLARQKGRTHAFSIVALVANASYRILAWFYGFQILCEGLPRNLTHSTPAQYPVDEHIQLRFQG